MTDNPYRLPRVAVPTRYDLLLEPIREQMDVIENGAYHARLLMYKGCARRSQS